MIRLKTQAGMLNQHLELKLFVTHADKARTASFKAPVTLYRITLERFLYRIGVLLTLRHCDPVRAAEQKSLRFFRDTKSNPVCTGAV